MKTGLTFEIYSIYWQKQFCWWYSIPGKIA